MQLVVDRQHRDDARQATEQGKALARWPLALFAELHRVREYAPPVSRQALHVLEKQFRVVRGFLLRVVGVRDQQIERGVRLLCQQQVLTPTRNS